MKWWLATCSLTALLAPGCATWSANPSTSERVLPVYVRRVSYRKVPEAKDLAHRAEQLANQQYPAVLALLSANPAELPQDFSIVFKRRLLGNNRGLTIGTKIYLAADWLAAKPEMLDAVLIHEMAHVAQAYKWYRWFGTPRFWQEGIADFVRFKLGYTNTLGCPQCSIEFPHYTCGFWCAGAFLFYLDQLYGPTVVRQLNAQIRQGTYSPDVFYRTTGQTLQASWTQFQQRPDVSRSASAANRLYDALGYQNGKPPGNVKALFEDYLKRHGEWEQFHKVEAYLCAEAPKSLLQRYAFYHFVTAPNGLMGAVDLLLEMSHAGQLPGFKKGQKGALSFGLNEECHCEDFPVTRLIHARKDGDPTVYHYTLVRESEEKPWKLQRAWQTGSDGSLVSEMQIK